jgi:hypothetical protein
MGRAIWRDLVIGFAAQLGELNLGFTQLAALYALADSGTMTVADLADTWVALSRPRAARGRPGRSASSSNAARTRRIAASGRSL